MQNLSVLIFFMAVAILALALVAGVAYYHVQDLHKQIAKLEKELSAFKPMHLKAKPAMDAIVKAVKELEGILYPGEKKEEKK